MTQEYLELENDMKQIKQLRTAYDKACNGYLQTLLKMWELDGHYGYWNSERPGTIYHYGETHNLKMEEIIFCVEHSVSEDVVLQWEDYLIDANEFGLSLPTLDAWYHGCPRTSQETFEYLRSLKTNLNNAVEEEKQRQAEESKE